MSSSIRHGGILIKVDLYITLNMMKELPSSTEQDNLQQIRNNISKLPFAEIPALLNQIAKNEMALGSKTTAVILESIADKCRREISGSDDILI